jgi:hypothetical protein
MNADTIKTQGQALAAALGKHWKFEPTCYDETPTQETDERATIPKLPYHSSARPHPLQQNSSAG